MVFQQCFVSLPSESNIIHSTNGLNRLDKLFYVSSQNAFKDEIDIMFDHVSNLYNYFFQFVNGKLLNKGDKTVVESIKQFEIYRTESMKNMETAYLLLPHVVQLDDNPFVRLVVYLLGKQLYDRVFEYIRTSKGTSIDDFLELPTTQPELTEREKFKLFHWAGYDLGDRYLNNDLI